ncbi:MAG: hypothetical protein J5669_03685 [Bacteroidales bacterium]|nr:hypothetical protein [Bacteroidales bacterium]
MIQSNLISLICMLAMLSSSCGCASGSVPEVRPKEDNTEVPGEDNPGEDTPGDEKPGEDQPGDDKPDEGEQQTHERYLKDQVFASAILDSDQRYSVLLPRSYYDNTDKRYPVVYMLHGYGDNQNSWNGEWLHAKDRIDQLEDAGMEEMIYVYPMGYQCYYVNRYNGSFNYMDMFAQELVPLIDASFRTIPDKQHRSITGYSMGGFGAYVLAAKHTELFCCSAPLSMSFRTDQQYMTESAKGWNSQWGDNFGGRGETGEGRLTDYYKEHCPYYVFNDQNRQELESVKWFFTCGDDEEQLLIANDSLHVVLRDRQFAHEYRVNNGAHTSNYWMNSLNEVLPMFSFYMNGGDKWPGNNLKEPGVPEITLDGNGAYQTEGYDGSGTLVLVAHKDLDKWEEAFAEFSRYSGSKYVLLPCDLSVKSLAEWKTYWAGLYQGSQWCIAAFGQAGAEAMAMQGDVQRIILYDASLGEDITPVKSCKYVILIADNGVNYHDMGALYTACKRKDCPFEYRVSKGTDNAHEDMLRILETYKSLFNF